jgi:chemotaxis protein MotB
MADEVQPIIIKKIVKGGHGHHGGAWKVAYADFVTAMMAFFLLMWLLNATTDDQKKGIADYFTPATVSKSKSGAGGLLGGQTVSSPGAMQSDTSMPSASLDLKPTSGASDGDAEEDVGSSGNEDLSKMSSEELQEALAKREEEAFDEAEQKLRQAIEDVPDLKDLAKNLVIDHTAEGLRIQVIDREGKPMFPSGSANMFERTRKLMTKIAQVIATTKNKVAISGHTDSTKFKGKRAGHGNWELSTGRALSSRRALVAGGLTVKRIARVVGKAATEPLLKDDPASARNRRISIVLLREGGPLSASALAKVQSEKKADFRQNWSGPRLR